MTVRRFKGNYLGIATAALGLSSMINPVAGVMPRILKDGEPASDERESESGTITGRWTPENKRKLLADQLLQGLAERKRNRKNKQRLKGQR